MWEICSYEVVLQNNLTRYSVRDASFEEGVVPFLCWNIRSTTCMSNFPDSMSGSAGECIGSTEADLVRGNFVRQFTGSGIEAYPMGSGAGTT